MPIQSLLTPREREVLRAVMREGSIVKVATLDNRSLGTLRVHVRNLHRKTDTHSLVELVTWGLKNLAAWDEREGRRNVVQETSGSVVASPDDGT